VGRGMVVLWNVATGKKLQTPARIGGEEVLLAQLNADGQTLLSVVIDHRPDVRHKTVVKSSNVATGAVLESFTFPFDTIGGQIAMSRDGRTLAVSPLQDGPAETRMAKKPAEIRMADVVSGKVLRTLAGQTQTITALAFREDGRVLASGSRDGSVILWDPASGSKLATLEGHATQVSSISLSHDGKIAPSGSNDGTIKIWDLTVGKELATAKAHTAPVISLAFSQDGKSLASASLDHTVILWEPTTGQQRATLAGHDGPFSSLAFSPDGKTLASAGDHSIRLYQAVFPDRD
jgi:WD40 repeat protein